ncbi:MAG: hypothetical protein ABIF10_04310 [Candidatus Woesearchaeota archaeon]
MFKESVKRLSSSFNQLAKHGTDLHLNIDEKKAITDFNKRRQYYNLQSYRKAIEDVRKDVLQLKGPLQKKAIESSDHLDSTDIPTLKAAIEQLSDISSMEEQEVPKELVIQMPAKLPKELAAEIIADIQELEKCYTSKCYRSCVILCGRLLETALHRKYFDVTGLDILEKNPGIGLGNLIAKLAEKNVQFDPGLTQQIHLINQVRIFSVHKKKESFYPSKDQTMAIILYTMDSLKKIF